MTDLLPPWDGVGDVLPEATASLRSPGEGAKVASTKGAMKPGVTLVARYKGLDYACQVVDEDGALRYVLTDGRNFRSPSAAGRAVTGSQVNGYRFWTIPMKLPAA